MATVDPATLRSLGNVSAQRPAVVSVSGGKDSHATAILAMDKHGPDAVRLVMADTGHEHPATMEFVTEYLPRALGASITILRANFDRQIAGKRVFIAKNWEYMGVPLSHVDRALELLHPTGNPFLDLCMWKGRFPSRKAQFCTEELKRNVIDQFMIDAHGAESWQGIRRDESRNRADALDYEPPTLDRPWAIVRPIAAWTAQQTVDFIRSRGHRLNPLYLQGMTRVGCMPCINCGKDVLREIAHRFPQEVDRVREWEQVVADVSKRGEATFFVDKEDGARWMPKDGYAHIDEVIEWAKTSRGGKQYDLERFLPGPVCSSVYGLCE